MRKIDLVLREVSDKINPDKEVMDFMNNTLKNFETEINHRIKKFNLDVELFVGGSFAKKTLIKKEIYDIDLFLRFGEKYSENEFFTISKKILKKFKKVYVIHGSRDYFKIVVNDFFYFEIIPVRKIKNMAQSKNITDLSYLHVQYFNKKIKSKKILEEIKLAKAFCSANGTYGAESYINGFSGYALELLIYYYGSFEKFLKEAAKDRKDKLIIDIEKKYKNSKEILLQLNGSKLLSPIVVIDPTCKERNVLAALSYETYNKFKIYAKKFLKNPSVSFFIKEKINLDELKKEAIHDGKSFLFLSFKTSKQEGDIAGTKLLKFHKHILSELSKFYKIDNCGFKYCGKNEGKSYFVLVPKSEIIVSGPFLNDEKNINLFKHNHKLTFIKDGKIYAKDFFNPSPNYFIKMWIKRNKKKIKDMHIRKIKFI